MVSVYEDLQKMVGQARKDKKRYAIVPEFAAWWATADEVNPLPTDWVLTQELGENNPDLVKRLLTTADSIRPETYFIVQKFTAEHIPRDSAGVYKWQDISPNMQTTGKTHDMLLSAIYEKTMNCIRKTNIFGYTNDAGNDALTSIQFCGWLTTLSRPATIR